MSSRLFSQHFYSTLVKSEWKEVHNREMSAITFWNKAKVNLITNLMFRWKPITSKSITKVLSSALYYYRKWLGSLDHYDRQLHAYYPLHRNIRWHNFLLLSFLKIAVNNTWIIANQLDIVCTLKETEQYLIKHLVSLHTLRKDEFKPVTAVRYDHFDHWFKEATKGFCILCLSNSKKSNTFYQCSKCKIHLHVLCFKKYHLE